MKFSKKNSSTFYVKLKEQVKADFESRETTFKGDYRIYLKAAILIGIYLSTYASIYYLDGDISKLLIVYFLMGISAVMVILNIVHDASHKTLSKHAVINRIFTDLGDVMGMNTYIWNIRHNIQHHTFTNVVGGDLIIDNIPLIRLSKHQTVRKYHKYQHLYAPILYLFYPFYLVFVIDFVLFFKKEVCNIKNIKHPLSAWLKLVGFKAFYILYILIFPYLFTPLSFGQAFLLLLFMHLCGSFLLSYISVLGHFVEGPTFPDINDGFIENNWAEHELETSIDFAPDSVIINWVTGGLNTHIVHHLFPSMCHIHYRRVTPIIKKFCADNGYIYKSHSLPGALKSHFRYLKSLSE